MLRFYRFRNGSLLFLGVGRYVFHGTTQRFLQPFRRWNESTFLFFLFRLRTERVSWGWESEAVSW